MRNCEIRKNWSGLRQKRAAQTYQEYISGKKTLIVTLKASGIDRESLHEIDQLYQTVVALAEKHQIEMDVLYDYASFLNKQNRHREGIAVLERLRAYEIQAGSSGANNAKTRNLLAILLETTNRFDDAEELHREALEICRALAEKSPEVYLPNVAITCNNLAGLLTDIKQFDQAENLLQEALEISRSLAEKNPEVYLPDMAMICSNLANLLRDTNRFDGAEMYYLVALDVYRTLVKKKSEVWLSYMATTCNNLAILHWNTKRFDKAENLLQEALEISRSLAEKNRRLICSTWL